MTAAVALGAGIYLGINFKVLVMLPFSILGAALTYFLCWMSDQNVPSGLDLILQLVCIQAGYVIGLTARDNYRQLAGKLTLRLSRRM